MKRKITSFHILSVILIEVILIEVFLIFSYIKKNHPNTEEKTKVTVEETLHPVVNLKSSPKKEKPHPFVFGTPTGQDAFFRDLLNKVAPPTFESGDYKLPDSIPYDNKFIATTYDLSFKSCGKYPGDPAYGITFKGTKAERGRTVAVDPRVIPLGSKLYIEFPEPYTEMNGWYVAEDTGSKVIGNIIDIFLGKSAFMEMEQFGSRPIEVTIVAPENPGS